MGMKTHREMMQEAVHEAEVGMKEGGIPIGSVLVHDRQIIGRGHNRRIQQESTIFHAEMDCLESAGRQNAEIYKNCILYSTLSPCYMCSGAVLLYNIPTVVIGENDTFSGPETHLQAQGVEIMNLNLTRCKEMMNQFISEHPDIWYEDIGK